MRNSNTRRTRPGDYKIDADLSDEYVWAIIAYLDPDLKSRPNNSALWVTAIAALLVWGLLWFRLFLL